MTRGGVPTIVFVSNVVYMQQNNNNAAVAQRPSLWKHLDDLTLADQDFGRLAGWTSSLELTFSLRRSSRSGGLDLLVLPARSRPSFVGFLQVVWTCALAQLTKGCAIG